MSAPASRRRPAELPLAAALALALLAGASRASDPISPTADYTLIFQAQWNATNHPVDFPGAAAHFSALVGANHAAGVVLWEPGGIASNGIEGMAEIGTTGVLSAEIALAMGAGAPIEQVLLGPALFGIDNSVSMDFTLSRDFPQVSVVTMVAPSPDWFLGVNGLSLIDGGDWVDELSVPLLAWDAGTDSGATFVAADADVTPHAPIALLSGTGPLAGNLTPLGVFTFTRTDEPTWEDLGHALAGTTGEPALVGLGRLEQGQTVELHLSGALPLASSPLVLGLAVLDQPFKGGVLVPSPDTIAFNLSTDATGAVDLVATWPGGPAGLTVVAQFWIQDPGGPVGWSASNGVCTLTF